MRKYFNIKNLALLTMIFTMVFSVSVVNTVKVEAATKKVALNKKKVTVRKGKQVTIKLKNVKKKVKWSVTSGKKNVKIVKKIGKYKNTIKVKGIKAGKAVVTAKVGKKKYKCKVTIKASKKTPNSTNKKPTVTNYDWYKDVEFVYPNRIREEYDSKTAVQIINYSFGNCEKSYCDLKIDFKLTELEESGKTNFGVDAYYYNAAGELIDTDFLFADHLNLNNVYVETFMVPYGTKKVVLYDKGGVTNDKYLFGVEKSKLPTFTTIKETIGNVDVIYSPEFIEKNTIKITDIRISDNKLYIDFRATNVVDEERTFGQDVYYYDASGNNVGWGFFSILSSVNVNNSYTEYMWLEDNVKTIYIISGL